MFEKKFTCIAKTLQGLEEVLANEIKNTLNIDFKILRRAVSFEADLKLLYRANLELRTALSIIIPLMEFEAKDANTLYRNITKYHWEDLISADNTISVHPTVYSVYFRHSQFAALKVKDAIVDRLRQKLGRRSNVDTKNADFQFNLHIKEKKVTLSLNSSGKPLNQRNYRFNTGEAPLNEVLAAGMILMTGYNGSQDFYDYMSGSGTLPIEAGLIATETPPGAFRRSFGFQNWPNFSATIWKEVYNAAMAKRHKPSNLIWASDQSRRMVDIARNNIAAAQLDLYIKLSAVKFEKSKPLGENGIIIMNLPYDKRLQLEEASEFYKMVSDILKNNFRNFDAWILGPKTRSFKSFALKPKLKKSLLNGSIECHFNYYNLF